MSYTEVSRYTTIPTDKSGDELKELVNTKLHTLTSFITNKDEESLKTLEDGIELLETFEEEYEDTQTILDELNECVRVFDDEVNISHNPETHRWGIFYPLLSLLSPLMNTEWVLLHTHIYDSRDGLSGDTSILTKDGKFLQLNNKTITLK